MIKYWHGLGMRQLAGAGHMHTACLQCLSDSTTVKLHQPTWDGPDGEVSEPNPTSSDVSGH